MPSRCYHCDQVEGHDPACIVAVAKRGGSVYPFVAVKVAVMRGAERVAVAVSHTMAKRIANALNNHTPNQRGGIIMLLVGVEEKETANALTIPRKGDSITWALGVPAFSTSTRSGVVDRVAVEDGGEWVFYATRDNGATVWGWLGNILTVNGERVHNTTAKL